MPRHDFSALVAHYPEVIGQMPDPFTSHEFILKLAQQHQWLYIEALYAYRDATHRGANAPFRVVHQILAQRLHSFVDQLILPDGTACGSEDIFRNRQTCTRWRKVT